MCNYAVSHAGFRPAAVLLHTPEADAVLLKAADNLGIACKELPPLRALRESLWSFWESGKQSLQLLQPVISLQCPFLTVVFSFPAVSRVQTFFVTQEAAKTLRHIPTLCRRMIAQGQLCPVDHKSFASLVRPCRVN